MADFGMTTVGATVAEPENATQYLVDGWTCNGLDTNATTVPSAVDGGEDLTYSGTADPSGIGAVAGYVTFDGVDQIVQAATAGAHSAAVGQSIVWSCGILLPSAQAGTEMYVMTDKSASSDVGIRLNPRTAANRVDIRYDGTLGAVNTSMTGLTGPYDDLPHTIALAYDADTDVITCYYDGVSKNTGTGGGHPSQSARKLTLGGETDAGVPVTGSLRSAWIYHCGGSLPSNINAIMEWIHQHPYQPVPESLWP